MLTAFAFAALISSQATEVTPQARPEAKLIQDKGLTELGAYRYLTTLTTKIGGRLSGSPQAAKAVDWAEAEFKMIGLSNVRRVPCMVPHWVRGKKERAELITPSGTAALSICALGGSVATPVGGLEAEVVEVHSLEEARNLGSLGKGKIVFFNRGFDPKLANTFAAYGGAVDQRGRGAAEAVKSGAVGVLVRSMTLATDDAPHTGAMGYGAGDKIPAAALGIQSAERLHAALVKGKVIVRFEQSCKNLPDVPSASVTGDLVGSEHPQQVVVVGGHLDSWDLAQGAHDDGTGITGAMEAVRLVHELGLKPKRTIRLVAFMNEENGTRGARAYAAQEKASQEVSYAAIESDSGGFMPRHFGVTASKLASVQPWEPSLRQFGIDGFEEGGGDADIDPLGPLGATLFSLVPDDARYFDYHHSRNDTLDKVNPRELEFGAMAMAELLWLLTEKI
jgi:hypothetical protein